MIWLYKQLNVTTLTLVEKYLIVFTQFLVKGGAAGPCIEVYLLFLHISLIVLNESGNSCVRGAQ